MDELYRLQQAAKTLAERQSQLGDVQERIRMVRGRAESDDGRIAVEVAPMGMLESLQLDPRAMRMASEDLAEKIVELVKLATDDANAQTQEAMKPLLGDTVNWQEIVENGGGGVDSEMFDRFMRDMGIEPRKPPAAPDMPRRSGGDASPW
jgi:DNA-binding protein YbaB